MGARRKTDFVPDYSFMHLGGLYQGVVDATVEACLRFGAEKAMAVIRVALDPCPPPGLGTMEAMQLEILHETGLDVTDDDMEFLGKLAQAKRLVDDAVKVLKGV